MSANSTHRVLTQQGCVDIAQNLILGVNLTFALSFALCLRKNGTYVVKMATRDIRDLRWLGI